MAFKAAFIAHVPDAQLEKHHWMIETPMYRLFVAFVKNQEQAVETCKKLVKEDGVQSFVLCPGFTHKNIAEIAEAVGEGVSINVSRGDGPSSRVATEIMTKEGWFSEKR